MIGPIRTGYSLVVGESELVAMLPAIASAGFDGIEPTFIEEAYPSPSDHLARARSLATVCGDLGLETPSLRAGTIPWGAIPSDDPSVRAGAIDHIRKACESLSILGGGVLLVVPGRRSPEVDHFTHWRRIVEFARAAGPVAAEHGMRIGLENVEARFPISETDWAKLIDEIAVENVGMYFDVGNVLWLGFGYPDQWIRTLGNRIIQIHFKDATYRLSGGTLHAEIRHILDGDVDWPKVMHALSDIAYEGWVSVEPLSRTRLCVTLPRRLYEDLRAILDVS